MDPSYEPDSISVLFCFNFWRQRKQRNKKTFLKCLCFANMLTSIPIRTSLDPIQVFTRERYRIQMDRIQTGPLRKVDPNEYG